MGMKWRFTGFLVVFLVVVLAGIPAAEARRHRVVYGRTDTGKDAALIVDGVSGRVLYARNANAPRHPASLTKLMTLYMLFDAVKHGKIGMDDTLHFSRHAAHQKPTNLSVSTGDTITVETAIKALIVRSANDVAAVVAEALGGSEDKFAEMMTATARQLGMRNTVFCNASGLPDRRQVTTASDLAILARHVAYDFPEFYHYFSLREFTYHGNLYGGHNNLLGRYDGADGMKTGYTAASGFNLVTSVTRKNVHIIGVVMGGRTAKRRDSEMMRLLDNTFDSVARTPTLVAHAALPWSKARPQLVASIDPAQAAARPYLPAHSNADDEESAELRQDEEEDSVPTPIPAPPSPRLRATTVSYQPARQLKRPNPPEVAMPALGIHDWTIQIGAFSDVRQARAQLAAYAEKSMDILGQSQRIVVPFQSLDGAWLYRARFGPFLESEARSICTRLTERGQTCFAAIAAR